MLEVYGDGAIKECVVRDSKSHIIKEYSGKSKDPVKHFEGVIYDIMNSRKLTEAVELMVNEPEKEDNINFANSKAVDKDAERQEKHLKQHEDKNKEKEFKVEKEPDQENTAGVKEEDLTDTAEVEALPKAKKTKVDAEKIKVKEIKESIDTKEIVMDEGEPEVLCVDQYNYIGPANKIDSMIKHYDMETPKWLIDELNSYNNKIVELKCGDHYPESFDKENCSISREVPTEEYIELLKQAEVPSRGGSEFGEKLKQHILNKLSKSVIKEREEIDPDYRPNTKFKHIDDVWEALDACKSKEEIQAVIDTIPEEFGSFVIEDNGDHITVINSYSEYDTMQEDKQDFYFKSTKLTEAEDELLDEPIITDGSELEDELEESGSDVAIFHRKPKSVDAMRAAEQNGITVNKSNYKIVGTKELSADEFNKFANNLANSGAIFLSIYLAPSSSLVKKLA